MIVLDSLFYYLVYWFDKNKEKLSWGTPLQRSAYLMGIMTMGILYSINEYLNSIKPTVKQFDIPLVVYTILALFVMWLYQYIYITKNRYQLIKQKIPEKLGVSDDTGSWVCIFIVGLLTLSPFLVTIITVPFGSGAVKN